jgi:hypothetical protein
VHRRNGDADSQFKRDSTNREAIAQILEYASWLDGTTNDVINACALEYCDKPLAEAFVEYFGNELQSLTPQNHRLLLVAPKLDASAERIVNYLAEKGLAINAVFFRYAKTVSGDEVLIRTILVPDNPVRTVNSKVVPATDLINAAANLNVSALVDECRKMKDVINDERPRRTYGGSFRYWLNGRMVFGVNVAGGRRNPPPGELDVWIPAGRFSEVSGVDEQTVRNNLKADFSADESGVSDCIVRLKNVEQARRIVSQLKAWLASKPAHSV